MEQEIAAIISGLRTQGYLCDRRLATALALAQRMGRPLLVEGPVGTGKTMVARAAAGWLGRRLIRLQCYEGLDEAKALYEWNYKKQLLHIQTRRGADREWKQVESSVFTPEFLLPRPLLQAITAESAAVLLIDEVDKVDEEFEALLLELLSEFQVTIPELGTIAARHVPLVVLTSNGARELSDALRRRCLYIALEFPSFEQELEIVRLQRPGAPAALAEQVVRLAQHLRSRLDLGRPPSVAETVDWLQALVMLGAEAVTPAHLAPTLGVLLKDRHDLAAAEAELLRRLGAAPGGGGPRG